MNTNDSFDDERPPKRRKVQRVTIKNKRSTEVASARLQDQDRTSTAQPYEDDSTLSRPPTPLTFRDRNDTHNYHNVNLSDHATAVFGNVYGSRKAPKLLYNAQAMFDAYGQLHKACHPATRLELLEDIRNWAQSSDNKRIFWLSGMAGTGKSTVAFTIAEELDKQERHPTMALGASFFFKRGDADRASAALFFPTIAYQLQQRIPELKPLIGKALANNPDICTQAVRKQFTKLIEEPLQGLSTSILTPTYIIVVDALDECDNEHDIRDLLELWPHLFSMIKVGLRLFLTSRPESFIRLGFANMANDAHQDIILHTVDSNVIRRDISVYLVDMFQRIRNDFNCEPPSGIPLSQSWPGHRILSELVDLAAPLFIVAATICRFIKDPDCEPQQQLDIIINSRKVGYPSHMAEIYLPILQRIASSASDVAQRQQIFAEFRLIVGTIVVLETPLSRKALGCLLGISPAVIFLRLRPLHSVLDVPLDVDAPVRPLHLSFGEFITSQDGQDQLFHVDSVKIHKSLVEKCLELLSQPPPIGLCQDMCQIGDPGLAASHIPRATVENRLSPAVEYACRSWTYHLQQSQATLRDDDRIHQFLQLHFLHWVEALILLELAHLVDSGLELLRNMIQQSVDTATKLSTFLIHVTNFSHTYGRTFRRYPARLYFSAILFSTPDNAVGDFYSEPPGWLQHIVGTSGCCDSDEEIPVGSNDRPARLTYSPNGRLLSSTARNVVRLWDTQSATAIRTYRFPCLLVDKILISPDNSMVAVVADNSLWLCRLEENQTCDMLGPLDRNAILVFSCDSSQLASGLDSEGYLGVWNTAGRQKSLVLNNHSGRLRAMAFSFSGLLLAFASNDPNVRLWNTATGQTEHALGMHNGRLNALAFSTDDRIFASGTSDGQIKIWDTVSGNLQHTLASAENQDPIAGIAFFPSGSMLIARYFWGSATIRLWDVKNGSETQRLKLFTSMADLRFTRDGQYICSGAGSVPVAVTSSSPDNKARLVESKALAIFEGWIQCAGQRLAYVPHVSYHTEGAVYGDQIALARRDGHITFLRIRPPDT